MEAEGEHFSASDGTRLQYRAWEPPDPRAALIVAHGLGEHSGRYAGLARRLSLLGVSTYAIDHRGHGASGGQRGHADRFDRYVEDFHAFRLRVAPRVPPAAPTFLLGHSMGGLIGIRYLQEHPDGGFRGVILSAPQLRIALSVPRWLQRLARGFSRLAPRLPFSNGIDAEDLSHDPAAVASYRADPLVHDRITARLFVEMLQAMEQARGGCHLVRTPTLFLVPEADPVVDSAATLEFAACMDPQAATVHRYPGLYHEPLNELEGERVTAAMLDWLEARMG